MRDIALRHTPQPTPKTSNNWQTENQETKCDEDDKNDEKTANQIRKKTKTKMLKKAAL